MERGRGDEMTESNMHEVQCRECRELFIPEDKHAAVCDSCWAVAIKQYNQAVAEEWLEFQLIQLQERMFAQ
jgi:hypothetical protein